MLNIKDEVGNDEVFRIHLTNFTIANFPIVLSILNFRIHFSIQHSDFSINQAPPPGYSRRPRKWTDSRP
jgi:hypothetical protein